MTHRLGRWVFGLGLAAILVYWFSVRPVGIPHGYSEDMCYPDMVRQLMADQLREFGKPTFITDRFMTPEGASVPYMAWSIERDWLGAYFWMWNKYFPFAWFYFGLSLVVTYLGVGWIVRRMGLNPGWAWALTASVVIFHVPRHFKIWHHYEHQLQHWIYFAFFLDAWIWQRFRRENRWSWVLELWRAFLMVGMLGTVGYFWGPLILEWALVRIAMLALFRKRKIQVEGSWRWAIPPVVLSWVMLAAYSRWYIPLFYEAKKLGPVPQGLGWFAHLGFLVRPLWLSSLVSGLPPIDAPETVVSIGWFFWIPAILAIWVLRKKKGGPGLGTIFPFFLLLILAFLYLGTGKPYLVHKLLQTMIPFMSFFRVASRWGLFLPQLMVILVVLAWPELRAWTRRLIERRGIRVVAPLVLLFVISSIEEMTWLRVPVNMMAPMPQAVADMLNRIRDLPGTSVLNLPFCVAGGNGVCTESQCPNYPYSTTGECLRIWHEKKIYGLYQSRMVDSHCAIYNKQPYQSWFNAWAAQRCFTDLEWKEFCGYLSGHPEISAILLHPDIWAGAHDPKCRALFDTHLGPPLAESSYLMSPTRGGKGANPSRIAWYGPRCRLISATSSGEIHGK